MKRKAVYTTGEAAEICHLSQQTIIRCFDDGQLGGFRVPGSRFRRIPHAELLKFMQANDIPLDAFGSEDIRVLIVDDDPEITETFADALTGDGRFDVRTARCGYDAGLLTEQFRPGVMLLDYMLPDVDGEVVCRAVRNNAELAHMRIVLVSGVVNPRDIDRLKAAGANEFIKKPFQPDAAIERIITLVES